MLPRLARQHSQHALAEKRHAGHLDEGAQDADNQRQTFHNPFHRRIVVETSPPEPALQPPTFEPLEYWRHYARGWLCHFFGRDERAAAAYREADAFRPGDPACPRLLGYLAARREDWGEAVAWFACAVERAPDHAESWFNLGFGKDKEGDDEDAIAAFRRALALKPGMDRAWYGLGLLLARQGKPDEAIAALQEATRLQPMNGVAWYQLGRACHQAGEDARVAEIIERLARFDPQHTAALVRESGRTDLAHLVVELPGR
ncbi:hypothetical protein OTERR_19210 [Oryzomicrobium terrae]|uniref:Uncharacterized protein n=1 Tax=Oryzomicrobium terrae TaxID=1735038 RepID=A0A5C1EB25_9RHOO|nr:tetratricopeptide repeat protein [Oryzomicrobium terrae]QEL65397.1 hypothetical protein OTERR_19210 [Oryzomicrobium terrae]